jgi:hypothetical protein
VFAVRAGAYPSGAPLAISASLRLAWKGQLGTNALAYNEYSGIKEEKSFITLAPGVPAIKLFLVNDGEMR